MWLNGVEQVPAIGMEMSLNGCLIATKQAPKEKSFNVIIEIERRADRAAPERRAQRDDPA